MVKRSLLSVLALAASFFAVSVIGLGAFTRLIEAGLGCPDWPTCYGHLIVPATLPSTHFTVYQAWAEMIHRYFAGTLSLLIIAIAIVVFRKANRSRSNIILVSCLFVLLAYQILLGQWTVTLKLLPIIVTQHLLGGFFILSVLWLIYLNNNVMLHNTLRGISIRGLLPWAIVALMILFFQIVAGAWTSTNYASLSCPDFPFCFNATPFLETTVKQTIQMTHRFGALVLTSYFLIFIAIAILKFKNNFELMKSAYAILFLLVLQLCLGISNVIFKLPVITAVSHTIVAVLLLLSLITLIFKLIKVRVR